MEELLDVAKYISEKISDSYWPDKKIQKLTYYAYCWYIAKNNVDENNITKRLFSAHPEAWIHGPVFYELYDEMTYNRRKFFERQVNLSKETKEFLDRIIYFYGGFTGNQLEDMTHCEKPWIEARKNLAAHERSREELKDDVIYSYYKN